MALSEKAALWISWAKPRGGPDKGPLCLGRRLPYRSPAQINADEAEVCDTQGLMNSRPIGGGGKRPGGSGRLGSPLGSAGLSFRDTHSPSIPGQEPPRKCQSIDHRLQLRESNSPGRWSRTPASARPTKRRTDTRSSAGLGSSLPSRDPCSPQEI